MTDPDSLRRPSTDEEWAAALKDYCGDREPSYLANDPTPSPTAPFPSPSLSRPLSDALSLNHDDPSVPRQGEDSGIGPGQSETFQNLVPTGLQAEYEWDDGYTCVQERERMRRHFEEHGWLSAPRPGRVLRVRRRKAIRHLGLASDDLGPARAIVSRVEELAGEIFGANVSITILRETDVVCITSPNQVEARSIEDSVEPHFCAMSTNSRGCVAIRDLDQDWRFANHPRRRTNNLTAAPIRFRQGRHEIVIGYLSLQDQGKMDESKDGILLHLADNLVCQLTTLQSHHFERHSNSMYEICTSFLRRSVARAKNRDRDDLEIAQDSKVELASSSTVDDIAVKHGPIEQMTIRAQDIGVENDLLQDYCSTLRGMLGAAVVTIIGLEDFNIYLKSSNGSSPDLNDLISAFNLGTPFPDGVEPVIHTSHENDRVPLVAYSCPTNAHLHLGTPHSRTALAGFLVEHLQKQRYWWERTDDQHDTADRVMSLLPDSSRTALSVVYFTPDATPKFVTLVGWDRPSSTFDETSVSFVHFAWVLGGSLRSALAVRRNRWMENSHLTYANTQAHNLKTPLHHILAITQILRSSITDLAEQQNKEQVKDLLPLMDAIDTSGSHLQSIVDNILSFLELKAMERISSSDQTDTYTADQTEKNQTLGPMLEEILAKAYDAEARARNARGEPPGRVETMIHVPEDLALGVVEDARGLLRAALVKLVANAYKAIVDEGCVEITIGWDSQNDQLEPTRQVRITLSDDGPGMSPSFVQDRLGEPWAKEDPNATGSGLSVYLAYRMVALLHGHMEISSGAGKGCLVKMVVPLSRQQHVHAPEPDPDTARKVSLVGFSAPFEQFLRVGLARIGTAVVEPPEAQVIIADGHFEESVEGASVLVQGCSIVYLVFAGHEPLKAITDRQAQLGVNVRRLLKPATTRVIKDALRIDPLAVESRPGLGVPRSARTPSTGSIPTVRVEDWTAKSDMGDLIAGLALGQMPEDRSAFSRTRSRSTEAVQIIAAPIEPTAVSESEAEPPRIQVLIVEDNVINRKLLVKMVKQAKETQRQITIVEAEDGEQAVEEFKGFTGPSIVLLDINMPKLDGFGASALMRSIEGDNPARGKSQIVAITAMSSEADRQRGLVECGMDAWVCKPISKSAIAKIMEQSRRAIMGN